MADGPRHVQHSDEFKDARFEHVSFEGARFRSVNLAGAKMVDAELVGARLSGLIDGLTVNDIEVAPLIGKEMERRYPERKKLFPADPDGFREALAVIEGLLDDTWTRCRKLPEAKLHERVDEEWSVVETIRHLVFVVDGWIKRVVLGEKDSYHAMGLPPTFLLEPPAAIDPAADPSFDEAIVVWNERLDVVRELIDNLTSEELEREVEVRRRGYPPEGTTTKVFRPLWTFMDETWAHNRFMQRTLDALE